MVHPEFVVLHSRPQDPPKDSRAEQARDAAPAGAGPAGVGPAPAGPAGDATQTQTQADGARQQQSMDPAACLEQNAPILIGFVLIFYFLIIRPQQKQEKERKQMQSGLAKGTKVVVANGMHGTIDAVEEHTITVQVDTDTKIVFDRQAVQRVLTDESASGAAS